MNFDWWFGALLIITAAAVSYSVWRSRHQGKIFEVVDRVTAQVNEFTLRVVELELELSGYRIWSGELRAQLIEARIIPAAPPPWLGQGRPVPRQDVGGPIRVETTVRVETSVGPTDSVLVAVYDRLLAHFNISEIDDLAFRVNIDKELLGGDNLSERAHALVMYAAKHLMMSDLVGKAAELRPDVEWPPVAAGNGHS